MNVLAGLLATVEPVLEILACFWLAFVWLLAGFWLVLGGSWTVMSAPRGGYTVKWVARR